MSGFTLTRRTVFDHPLFDGDSARLGAWLWLVGKACWKPTPFDNNGKMLMLERGQICVSVRHLAERWGWSKSAVDRFLTRLETETMIERKAGHGKMVITICNYSKYQDREDDDRDSSGTAGGTAAGQQRDIKEQVNKETIDSPLPPAGKSSRKALAVDCPDHVPVQVWSDFLEHRKQKRAPVTQTALQGIVREAEKAGWSLEAALTETMVRGWQSFKAEYVERRNNGPPGQPQQFSMVDQILSRREH